MKNPKYSEFKEVDEKTRVKYPDDELDPLERNMIDNEKEI